MSVEHHLLVKDPDGIQTGEPILMLKGGHYRPKDDHMEQPGGHHSSRGDNLSLIKGVMMQGEDARGHAFNRTRKVLKHLRYDKDSGHFVATEKGAVPVVITIGSEDGGSASMRDFLYIVEELSSVFISRDALASLGIIRKEFPKVPNNASLVWVAGVQGSSDTAIDQPCIKPTNFAGDTDDCGCPVQELPPALPFEPTVENKEKMKQFLLVGLK